MAILIAFATVISTFFGGLFALRFKDKLHLILGFSAGAVIGVAFFDLLPEAIELSEGILSADTVTMFVAFGFLLYMLLDRLIDLHSHGDDSPEAHSHRGSLGAGSLAFHSMLDGLAIGLAFQVSSAAGLVVAAAVLAHDFSDGINMVNMVLKNKGDRKGALRWLTIDALAPALGAVIGTYLVLPVHVLGAILAVFCGFFMYIGASDLLPESHHRHPALWTTFMTIFGALAILVIIRTVHG